MGEYEKPLSEMSTAELRVRRLNARKDMERYTLELEKRALDRWVNRSFEVEGSVTGRFQSTNPPVQEI